MKNILFATAAAVLLVLARPAAAAPPLVDAAWARAHAGAADVVFLDIRAGGAADYAAGHIPGAVFSDYGKAGWRVKNAAGTVGMLPPVGDLEKLVGGLGIGRDDHVVIVARGLNASDMGSATRVYWTFKVLGHDAVSILDGGMKAYVADKSAPLSTAPVTPTPVAYAATVDRSLLADKADVEAALDRGVTLIDNRTYDQHVGVNRSGVVARFGTVPTARSLPQDWLTENNGGTFRKAADIAALYDAAGLPKDGAAITFCNTGHWASVGWFVAHEILGNKKTRMYDGSMTEWAADPAAPMQRKVGLNEAAAQ